MPAKTVKREGVLLRGSSLFPSLSSEFLSHFKLAKAKIAPYISFTLKDENIHEINAVPQFGSGNV
jgi:hypothetical protein